MVREYITIILFLALMSFAQTGCFSGHKLIVVVDGVEHTFQWSIR